MLDVILVAGGLWFAQGLPPPMPAPQVTVQNNVTVSAPPPDPQAIADAAVTSSEAVLAVVVAPTPQSWADQLLGLPDVWRTTPPELTYQNGPIKDMANGLQQAALLFGTVAILACAGAYKLHVPIGSKGRVIAAAALAYGNLNWWQAGISINNDLTSGIAAPSLPSLIQPFLTTTVDATTAVSTVLLVIVYAVVALLLLFSLLFRLGMIDILIAVGSLALFCYATPWTEHFAKTYVRLSVGLLFSQVLIVLGLRVASVLGTMGGGITGTLLSIVVLLLITRLPGLLAGGEVHRAGLGFGLAAFTMVKRRVGL